MMQNPILWWSSLCVRLMFVFWPCASAGKQCHIQNEMADCSHLKLTQIPSDLPNNITSLDISHNQLRQLGPANLTKYSQLVYLNAGYNSISKLQPELCQNVPLLQILKLEHNELYKLPDRVFASCTNLTELNLGYNRLNIKNDPFKTLKNLNILDLSHNSLKSANLGSEQQLEKLYKLMLGSNQITELKKEDFSFLSNTSLNSLDLSSNPLEEFHMGCFHTIGNLCGLILNNVQLGENRTKKLCTELSNTAIRNLSLSRVKLSYIGKSTFQGLQGTNLTILNLSQNSLSVVEDDSFQWLSSLQYLNLKINNIHVSSRLFYGLSSLKYLNLINSIAGKIEDFSFHWLYHLEYLIMDNNNFPGITANMFTGLKNLKYLSLCNCNINLQRITDKTFSSLANSSLHVLNLTKTRISTIESGAFSSLGHLKILDLGLNEISQQLTGHEFKGLNNIQDIYLSYNKNLTLQSESFIFVPGLKKLMLRKVGCSNLALSPSPFHPLRNLTVLDISNNNIANIKEDLFDGLDKLDILDLQHNNLARLWKHANPDGPVLFLKGLPNLQILNLKSNGLDEIPVQVFKGLLQLKHLDLGSNNLNLLPATLFDNQASLNSLNLQKNLITSVEEKVFGPPFKSLRRLEMDSNPFDCTCESIAWFADWLNETQADIPGLRSQYICNTPPKYHGSLVLYFDSSACKDSAPFKLLFVISTSIVTLFIFIVLTIHFEGWRIAFYWNILVNRMLGFKEFERQQEQYDYDAYVIHAREDKNWVSKNFMSLEENNHFEIKFCLEERDFEAGVSVFEATINSIKMSRKIIFVVTEHLLQDPWCKNFKVYHALQQAIEQSRDSIILIFLDDIQDYKLYHALHLRRGMFRSRCILNWPAQKERVSAFHQQLVMALKCKSKVH
ncbi:toll-like receptor 3 [Motacilla alba alba]|uniref:toll-like receptor 3 n=1 Tax=Motacilla alba alba TaxID=1094192 RepID=UPI0018D55FEE|nr:toll-like receptor 3 [Motacilla alba alba]XP_037990752.1 toll-like receptor 3 [Motacilla alba alba]XP_037990753.1 toll-like receptor 3 [Motacilla alba alba]XP_037990754.1 toll-like receptor 3 [Motacilla alba alba]